MDEIYDVHALRSLSEAQRRRLLQDLLQIERESERRPGGNWKWDALLVLIVASCVVLAAWIGYLVVTLPSFYRAGSWRGAWVGFDLALLVTFATTGWAAWRRRQVLIVALIVLATLLTCDAWFDVVLDARTPGFLASLLSALIIELPLAVLAVLTARRLLHLTIGQVMRDEGQSGQVPSLRQMPLVGVNPRMPLRRLVGVSEARKKAHLPPQADG